MFRQPPRFPSAQVSQCVRSCAVVTSCSVPFGGRRSARCAFMYCSKYWIRRVFGSRLKCPQRCLAKVSAVKIHVLMPLVPIIICPVARPPPGCIKQFPVRVKPSKNEWYMAGTPPAMDERPGAAPGVYAHAWNVCTDGESLAWLITSRPSCDTRCARLAVLTYGTTGERSDSACHSCIVSRTRHRTPHLAS